MECEKEMRDGAGLVVERWAGWRSQHLSPSRASALLWTWRSGGDEGWERRKG